MPLVGLKKHGRGAGFKYHYSVHVQSVVLREGVALPPDATCLACGGIQRIDQVRALRRAGYDGVVLGRVLAGPDGDALLAQIAADSEVASDSAQT